MTLTTTVRPDIVGVSDLTDEQWQRLREKAAEVMVLGYYITIQRIDHFYPGEEGEWLVARVEVDGETESWDWIQSWQEWMR